RFLNYAANPDLSDFTARGGKLLLYHGWADGQVAPQGTIDYFELATRTMGGAQAAGQFM
ncbi:MAG: tannase/feruloyl esterase family alpha/beta hydrolase, partial [Planctomycetales bacterium]|nr:tannase/feruloyl esterase family alpha/beta hydrolase [Planctomycetales bacterium]